VEESTLRLGRARVAEGAGSMPSWNHWEFSVSYPSLAKHLCVGGVYVKLLVHGRDQASPVRNPNPWSLLSVVFR
jgi:DNAJ protein RME-8 N-terminal